MILMAAVYLGGSTLASAETRMFTMIAPVLLAWIVFVMMKTVKIKLKFRNGPDQ